MRILLTSDLHGVEDAFRSFSRALGSDYDVGVIAGDLLDDQLSETDLSLLTRLRDQPSAIGQALAAKEARIDLKSITIGGVSFVGYGCISRALGPDLQMASLQEIENFVDEKTILVTHIPPRGTLDLKSDNGHLQSFGSGILADLVAAKKPRFHFFGDAHDSVGVRGTSINASYPLVSSFCGADTETGDIWTERA